MFDKSDENNRKAYMDRNIFFPVHLHNSLHNSKWFQMWQTKPQILYGFITVAREKGDVRKMLCNKA